tara:strand:+ start:2538 stop:3566 length:1029 start_codon:yes stop_codon:yes gene_type:complete
MRYTNTERLGVNETESIVLKEFNWIFRDQPIVDVGIDAIIEECLDDEPTGKLLALQIKSGESIFHISEKNITYYISRIHYNYWLNLNIPIILVAHFPQERNTYWQEITKSKIKKTKKQWKLDIPKNQKFNSKAKNRITEFIYGFSGQDREINILLDNIDEETIYDLVDNVKCISEASVSMNNIVKTISEMNDFTVSTNTEFDVLINQGLSDKDSQVKALINGLARTITITAKRMDNESELFAELFSIGFYSFEKIAALQLIISPNVNSLEYAFANLKTIPNSVETALEGIKRMRNGIVNLPRKYTKLKEARYVMIEVIDLLIYELNIAQEITNRIIKETTLE